MSPANDRGRVNPRTVAEIEELATSGLVDALDLLDDAVGGGGDRSIILAATVVTQLRRIVSECGAQLQTVRTSLGPV